MFKYKRGINNWEKLRQVEYVLSDGYDTCLSMSACLDARKPYNGLYIKNGRVIVENLIEKIEVKDKVYKMVELSTSIQNLSTIEYLNSVDLNENLFEYNLGGISYSKKITFSNKYKLLCISYKIQNNEKDKASFKVIPMVTYRDLFSVRTGKLAKFNQRKSSNNTVIINLSIMDDENLVMGSDNMIFTSETRNLNNVKHEFVNKNDEKEIYTEDLFLPGEFEIEVKPGETKNAVIYISSEEKDLKKLDLSYILTEFEATNKLIEDTIDENFVELKELAMSINNLNFEECMVSSLPYVKDYNKEILKAVQNKEEVLKIKEDIKNLNLIVRSIDGQYLTFNKINQANKILLKIRRYIKNIEALYIESDDFVKEFLELKLWYVEAVNRVLQKENNYLLYFDMVKEIVYEVINKKALLYNEIKYVALAYNAFKVYESILKEKSLEDIKIFDEIVFIHKIIKESFWNEDKRLLKRNLEEKDEYANVDMIYTLALSYSCLMNDMPFKLLDTIFKELYTPYGLREFSKNSKYNDSLVYPKYMAYFVKANLRQNGVTRASQKIAFNMVKELIQDIGKYVNGGVKEIYHEKGHNIDSIGYDLFTNAEVIRLYDMLT